MNSSIDIINFHCVRALCIVLLHSLCAVYIHFMNSGVRQSDSLVVTFHRNVLLKNSSLTGLERRPEEFGNRVCAGGDCGSLLGPGKSWV